MDENEKNILGYATPPKRDYRKWRIALTCLLYYVVTVCVVTFFVVVLFATDFRGDGALWALGFGMLSGWWTRRRVRKRLLDGEEDDAESSEILFTLATFLFVIAIWIPTLRPLSCAHGTVARVGPVFVAHSDAGGPCRNSAHWSHRWHVGGHWYICY